MTAFCLGVACGAVLIAVGSHILVELADRSLQQW